MAPSFDCMISLFCAEEASGGIWEDEAGSYADEENVEDPVPPCLPELPVEEDEVIALLVEKEESHMPQDDYVERFASKILDFGSRQDAVSWILNVQAYYNFCPLTAYLAVNYLDRFLSTHQIPRGKAWMLQLLAVACVSLAAKMEETEVPLLLDLQVGGVQHVFEARTIQRMELLILSTLKWRMRSVTPFSYVGYLLHKIGMSKQSPGALLLRVEELILNTCRVMSFLVHRPSVIAVASVLRACEELLPMQATTHKEVILSALPVGEGYTLECSRLMQELLEDPFWTSIKMVSRNSSAPQSPIGVLDAACFSCDSDISSSTRSAASIRPMAAAHDVSRKRKIHELCSVVVTAAASAAATAATAAEDATVDQF